MRRRDFIAAFGIATISWPAAPQVSKKRPLIAILHGGDASRWMPAFTSGLNDLGYVEGRDIDFVTRSSEGDYTRLPTLAEELVSLEHLPGILNPIRGAL